MNERIQKRIEELTKARDAYVEQANREIAAFGGAIAELTALLAPEGEQQAEGAKPEGEAKAAGA